VRAIPQYTHDYAVLKPRILSEAEKISGLRLAGNYLGGISLPDTVDYAYRAAQDGRGQHGFGRSA
jgi:protoporphyrinogen oxidase